MGNCLVIKTIVVKPHIAELISNAGNSGSSGAVGTTFRLPELADLNTYCLVEGASEKLRSGRYYITKTSDVQGEACYLAGTSFPVTADNMEFAFQFTYGEIQP